MTESSSSESPDSEALERAWEEVDRAWDDPETHRRFLALASTLGRLDVAGARYRAMRDANPARREQADAQIQKLLGLALASLGTLKSAPLPNARRWVNVVGVALGFLLFALAAWALLRLY